jgi:hypothetical protein
VQKLEEDEFNMSSQYINECSFYYEECSRILRNLEPDSYDEDYIDRESLETFNEEFRQQMLITDAKKVKHDADLLLDLFINYEERLDIEKVWDTIDMYRVAIMKTKDKDLELEAEILSIIGLIYDKVLKIESKSRAYYYDCFNLCESSHPKTFNTREWFKRLFKIDFF